MRGRLHFPGSAEREAPTLSSPWRLVAMSSCRLRRPLQAAVGAITRVEAQNVEPGYLRMGATPRAEEWQQ
jgi:hypothetical protein